VDSLPLPFELLCCLPPNEGRQDNHKHYFAILQKLQYQGASLRVLRYQIGNWIQFQELTESNLKECSHDSLLLPMCVDKDRELILFVQNRPDCYPRIYSCKEPRLQTRAMDILSQSVSSSGILDNLTTKFGLHLLQIIMIHDSPEVLMTRK